MIKKRLFLGFITTSISAISAGIVFWLCSEFVASERQHRASRADRAAIHKQIEANHRIIVRLLRAIETKEDMRTAAP